MPRRYKVVGSRWIKLFSLRHIGHPQSHTRNGSFKLMVALLWIYSGFFSQSNQHCWSCDHTHTITWSRGLIYSIGSYIKRTETNEKCQQSHALLQVKTNLTPSAKLTKTILVERNIFRKSSWKKRIHFDKTSLKKRNSKKYPAMQWKNSPIVRENRTTGNTSQYKTKWLPPSAVTSRCTICQDTCVQQQHEVKRLLS